jgi:hypothetical protein
MDYTSYGDKRWEIHYGNYSGIERVAVDHLYGLVQSYVPYVLTVVSSQNVFEKHVPNNNRIIIGTLGSNQQLVQLAQKGFFEPETRAEGYSIKTATDPDNPQSFITVLQGADEAGVLYAVADYQRYAIRKEKYHGYHYNKRYRPYIDGALPFERRSSPKIEHRGLWTWGHVIYDYEGYIDHMCACKLNTLIIWNDYAPINAKEIIRYAHDHAVKVIWGFSWCWGQKVNPNDAAELKKWTDFVINTYESQYLPLGCDGIYFQAFTETRDTTIDGNSISELVINWVNSISEQVYDKYPDLWIQFGVHATSIRDECHKFSAIDNRMSIVWEDAGGFPYYYDPSRNDDGEETLAYTKELLAIRGSNERFGAVLKGFTVLNWLEFEHQKGPYILGKADKIFQAKRSKEKEFYWRYAAPYWINQAPYLQKVLQSVADAQVYDRLITALVEDGMWESGIHISLQLLSELLWDPNANLQEILTAIMHDERTLI